MRFMARAMLFAVMLSLAAIGVMAFTARQDAPEVAFRTLGGERFSTLDLRGKAVLVNFWATSCVTCIKEMPMLTRAQQKFGQDGYVTVAVAMSYDTLDQVTTFVRQNRLPFKVVFDADGEIAKAFGNIRVTPTSFLLSRKGEIAKQFVGEPKVDWLHAAIEQELLE